MQRPRVGDPAECLRLGAGDLLTGSPLVKDAQPTHCDEQTTQSTDRPDQKYSLAFVAFGTLAAGSDPPFWVIFCAATAIDWYCRVARSPAYTLAKRP